MITKFGILNFQSIEQMAVECGPITVFVGESDSGKSAVVRALYAAAFNDYPSDHVRSGAADSMVVIATEDGSVQVEKGKGKNGYALNRLHTETQLAGRKEWERVGRDVPEEVVQFLGWRVVELDDGTKFVPSIQRQFDGPFLLSDSASKVAKVLGSLTNISILFAAIREGTNEERRARQAVEVAKEEWKRHEEAKAALAPAIEAAVAKAAVVEEAARQFELTLEDLRVVEILEEAVVKAADELAAARERLNSIEVVEVPDLDEEFAEIQRLRQWESALTHAAAAVEDRRGMVESLAMVADNADRALSGFVAEMKICPLCGSAL